MHYQIGKPGRILVVRFGDGDDVLQGLADICRQENVRAASFSLVGGMKRGRFVVGPETEEMPPVPEWRELVESHEAVGFGTIFCSVISLKSISTGHSASVIRLKPVVCAKGVRLFWFWKLSSRKYWM